MMFAGNAKLLFNSDADTVAWFRRRPEANREPAKNMLWRATSVRAARHQERLFQTLDQLPGPFAAASACSIFFAISALTASRLKLAPRCIGGNSRKVCSSLAMSC
jgi:hypothetical protein